MPGTPPGRIVQADAVQYDDVGVLHPLQRSELPPHHALCLFASLLPTLLLKQEVDLLGRELKTAFAHLVHRAEASLPKRTDPLQRLKSKTPVLAHAHCRRGDGGSGLLRRRFRLRGRLAQPAKDEFAMARQDVLGELRLVCQRRKPFAGVVSLPHVRDAT